MQVRVTAALTRIAAQKEQSFEGGEDRVNKWDKARREKEIKEEREIPPFLRSPSFLCQLAITHTAQCSWIIIHTWGRKISG